MSWGDYLKALQVKLTQVLGGDGGANHTGAVSSELPILSVSNLTTILTQFSPALVHAVTTRNMQNVVSTVPTAPQGKSDRVPNFSFVSDDGSFNGSGDDLADINAGNGNSSISAAEYVAGSSQGAASSWIRWNVAPGISYEICSNVTVDISGGNGPLSMLRQAMYDWDQCVAYAANQLTTYGADWKMDGGSVESYWLLLAKLCVDLDVLEEDPPDTATIGEAWSYAVDKTGAAIQTAAKAGGEALATAGAIAGNAAGSFASGFFSKATFVTLAVAGIAVFVIFR